MNPFYIEIYFYYLNQAVISYNNYSIWMDFLILPLIFQSLPFTRNYNDSSKKEASDSSSFFLYIKACNFFMADVCRYSAVYFLALNAERIEVTSTISCKAAPTNAGNTPVLATTINSVQMIIPISTDCFTIRIVC